MNIGRKIEHYCKRRYDKCLHLTTILSAWMAPVSNSSWSTDWTSLCLYKEDCTITRVYHCSTHGEQVMGLAVNGVQLHVKCTNNWIVVSVSDAFIEIPTQP